MTHGNGPQVGLLALWTEAYSRSDGAVPYPLDVLGAESSGQIGYVIELELDNAIEGRATVAIITRTLVSADDPAFGNPTKFIGPIYEEADAKRLAAARGWVVKPDGAHWRRVVPSPEPRAIVQLDAVRDLVEAGFTVVCTGGGGVPVVRDAEGRTVSSVPTLAEGDDPQAAAGPLWKDDALWDIAAGIVANNRRIGRLHATLHAKRDR